MKYFIKLHLHLIIQILIVILCAVGMAYIFVNGFPPAQEQFNKALDYNLFLKAKPIAIEYQYDFISNNSIKAVSPAFYILENEPMGALIEEPKIDELFNKIVWCESKGDYTAKNPNSSAYGICQILDSTWNYIQKKWDMKLDRYSTSDQEYACKRLLLEEGLIHWQPTWDCIFYETTAQ